MRSQKNWKLLYWILKLTLMMHEKVWKDFLFIILSVICIAFCLYNNTYGFIISCIQICYVMIFDLCILPNNFINLVRQVIWHWFVGNCTTTPFRVFYSKVIELRGLQEGITCTKQWPPKGDTNSGRCTQVNQQCTKDDQF